MIVDGIRALLFGSLPVAAFTFLVLQWSIASGRLSPFEDSKSLHKQFKDQKKAVTEAKAEAKRRKKAGESIEEKAPKQPLIHKDVGRDFIHNKVMFFGGGFYGTMALFTYGVVEIGEIFGFLGVVFTPGEWFKNLGFDLIIQFFINSIMNIVAAFIWFKTLTDYVTVGNGFVWLAAAYLGYLAGLKIVSHRGDIIWAHLTGHIGRCVEMGLQNFAKVRHWWR